MLTKSLAFAALLGLAAVPLCAQGLENMTASEREAFGEEVRAYLLENPEVLMEAIGILEERQAVEEAEAQQLAVVENADALYRSLFDFVGGNPDGDITIVEFFDYRCSFCRRAHPEVQELIASDGNIRHIVKEFPILGDASVLASRFAIATRIAHGDEAYDRMNNALMVLRGDVTDESLVATALELGLDPDPILASLADPLVQTTISYNYDLAQRLGITGTPSFVFGDQLVQGYVPLDGMRDLVAELRASAE